MTLGAAPLRTETFIDYDRPTLELLAETVAKLPNRGGELSELRLYRRSDNCFACVQSSRVPEGRQPAMSVLITTDKDEVYDFFGKGPLSQQLFTQLEHKALHIW